MISDRLLGWLVDEWQTWTAWSKSLFESFNASVALWRLNPIETRLSYKSTFTLQHNTTETNVVRFTTWHRKTWQCLLLSYSHNTLCYQRSLRCKMTENFFITHSHFVTFSPLLYMYWRFTVTIPTQCLFQLFHDFQVKCVPLWQLMTNLHCFRKTSPFLLLR